MHAYVCMYILYGIKLWLHHHLSLVINFKWLYIVIYSWKCAKMAEKVMNYPCSRFNVSSSTPLFSIHSKLIFPENSNNMKACSMQRYDKNIITDV